MIPLTALFGGLILSVLVMVALWLWQLRSGHPAIVDVAWTFLVGVNGALLALSAEGTPDRRILAAVLIIIWSLRLGIHLAFRFRRHPVDSRYTAMKARWGDQAESKMLGFFMLQAIFAVIFAFPVLAAATGPAHPIFILVAGLVVMGAGLLGVLIADYQLTRFLTTPGNQGQICKAGLWGWSRHPNYFFEWLIWCGWAILSTPGPLWWVGTAGMWVMLFFLLKVTGIPHVEREALRKRGDAWREYQRTTSAFIPLPPKRNPSS